MLDRTYLLVVLSVPLAGCGDTDGKPAQEATATAGSTGSGGATTEPEACPGVADPECTTSAACGNGEICVSCECVPQPEDCADPGAADCVQDDDCGQNEECFGCMCTSICDASEDQCVVDADCGNGETCDASGDFGCECVGSSICPEESDCEFDDDCATGTCQACECVSDTDETTGSPPLDGESDPVEDCTNDDGDAPCVPSMDLEVIGLDCPGGDATVRIQVASGMVNDMPADYDTFQAFFHPTGGGEAHWVRGFGQGGAYDCDYRIGAAYMPLGPADVCEVNAADGTFDITLSAATSGATFESITVESTLSQPYLYDGAGPFDFTCP